MHKTHEKRKEIRHTLFLTKETPILYFDTKTGTFKKEFVQIKDFSASGLCLNKKYDDIKTLYFPLLNRSGIIKRSSNKETGCLFKETLSLFEISKIINGDIFSNENINITQKVLSFSDEEKTNILKIFNYKDEKKAEKENFLPDGFFQMYKYMLFCLLKNRYKPTEKDLKKMGDLKNIDICKYTLDLESFIFDLFKFPELELFQNNCDTPYYTIKLKNSVEKYTLNFRGFFPYIVFKETRLFISKNLSKESQIELKKNRHVKYLDTAFGFNLTKGDINLYCKGKIKRSDFSYIGKNYPEDNYNFYSSDVPDNIIVTRI